MQSNSWLGYIWLTFNSWITYVWSGTTVAFALLSFQDYTFIIATAVGAFYARRSFLVNRAEKLASIADMKRRTDIYEEWLKNKDPNSDNDVLKVQNVSQTFEKSETLV